MDSQTPVPANPLFNLPPKKDRVVTPLPEQKQEGNEAVELIRNKINTLYAHEPDAKEEEAEAEAVKPRSKHQQFMYDLSNSGKSLAEIQTAWHNYYVSLPDNEKHEVWQEFYDNHGRTSRLSQTKPTHQTPTSHHATHHSLQPHQPPSAAAPRTASEIKQQLLHKIAKPRTKHKQRLKSLGFGLSMGLITLAVLMFGFFNERFIAPFITPSRTVTSTPIITDATAAVGPEPKVIIPKINVEIPVIYDEPSIDEHAVQRALEDGVLHYATTSNPGEQGNSVIFGHSSNNILNKGKYKFAFVLLHRLEVGDTFMLQKDGKRYIYKIFEKKIVKPDDVSVLQDRDKPTATLITCDPPGTSLNRLIVVGEQISPDPTQNVASTAKKTTASAPTTLPANAPTLWSRFWNWISS